VSGVNTGTGKGFSYFKNLILDKVNNVLVVADANNKELITVDIATGDRRDFTNESTNRFGLSGISGLVKSEVGDWYALYNRNSLIRKYSPKDNNSIVVSSNASGPRINPLNIEYSNESQQLTILTSTGVEVVNSFSATKTLWIENEIDKSLIRNTLPPDADFTNSRDLCFNEQRNSLLHLQDQGLLMDSIMDFNITTRNNQIISDQTTGSGDELETIIAIACPVADDKVYLLNRYPGVLYSLNITNGHREKIMDIPNISGEDIKLTNDGKFAYISSTGFSRALQKIDLENKTYTILSSNNVGNGIQISNPRELAFDEKHQRLFVIDSNAIILVDVLSGDRIIFSKR